MRSENITKDKILKTAAELFAEMGYERTSMREIAARCAITKPALYYYFPDKKTLFQEIIETVIKYNERASQEIADSNQSPVEKLYALAFNRFRQIKVHPEIARFLYKLIVGEVPYDIALDLIRIFQPYVASLNRILREGQELGVFAAGFDFKNFGFCLTGGINFYVMRYFHFGIDELDEQNARLLINTLLNGIRKPKSEVI